MNFATHCFKFDTFILPLLSFQCFLLLSKFKVGLLVVRYNFESRIHFPIFLCFCIVMMSIQGLFRKHLSQLTKINFLFFLIKICVFKFSFLINFPLQSHKHFKFHLMTIYFCFLNENSQPIMFKLICFFQDCILKFVFISSKANGAP